MREVEKDKNRVWRHLKLNKVRYQRRPLSEEAGEGFLREVGLPRV